MTITFRNDRPDDFINVLREVGQWLIDNGQVMWDIEDLSVETLVDDFTRDNCHVMYVDGIPAATFILQWKDPLYYDNVPDGTAGFVHKVAIRRTFAGQNLFQWMLDFCLAEGRKKGVREIQLETDATRPKSMAFYERYGFEPTYRRSIEEFGKVYYCQYYRMACLPEQ